MPGWLIILLLAALFAWAGLMVRGRYTGPTARDDRHRATGGGDAMGAG